MGERKTSDNKLSFTDLKISFGAEFSKYHYVTSLHGGSDKLSEVIRTYVFHLETDKAEGYNFIQ